MIKESGGEEGSKEKGVVKANEVRKCFLIRHKLLSPFAHRI